MKSMLFGAIVMASFTISLAFMRFWKETNDRFFLYFAISFLIEGTNRAMLGVIIYSSEQEPLFYILRLFSFLIILWAIVEKNWIGGSADRLK